MIKKETIYDEINKKMKLFFYILDRIYLTFAYNFAPFLISRSIAKRKGYCKYCGYCCGNCSALIDKKCNNYKNIPKYCHKDFPVNKFERKYLASKDCGYYWDIKKFGGHK